MNEKHIKLGNTVHDGFSTLGESLSAVKKTTVVRYWHIFILKVSIGFWCRDHWFHIGSVLASLTSQLHCNKLDLPNFKKRVLCEIFIHVSKQFQEELRIEMTVKSENILDAFQVLVIRVLFISPLVWHQWTTFFFTLVVVWINIFFMFIAIFNVRSIWLSLSSIVFNVSRLAYMSANIATNCWRSMGNSLNTPKRYGLPLQKDMR